MCTQSEVLFLIRSCEQTRRMTLPGALYSPTLGRGQQRYRVCRHPNGARSRRDLAQRCEPTCLPGPLPCLSGPIPLSCQAALPSCLIIRAFSFTAWAWLYPVCDTTRMMCDVPFAHVRMSTRQSTLPSPRSLAPWLQRCLRSVAALPCTPCPTHPHIT